MKDDFTQSEAPASVCQLEALLLYPRSLLEMKQELQLGFPKDVYYATASLTGDLLLDLINNS